MRQKTGTFASTTFNFIIFSQISMPAIVIQYYLVITVPLGTIKFDCYMRLLFYQCKVNYNENKLPFLRPR